MTNEMDIEYGQKNYDSTLAPFFRKFADTDESNHTCDSIIDNNLDIINIFTKINLPKEITNFYINNNAIDKELYIKEWTLFSINKIIDMYDNHNKDNIINIVDLGFKYLGMGWIKVAFYNLKLNKIYYRHDGGSNGYDRLDNYDKLKKYSKDYNSYTTLSINNNINGINFSEFLDEINSIKDETSCIAIH